jgi:hypothetical protein
LSLRLARHAGIVPQFHTGEPMLYNRLKLITACALFAAPSLAHSQTPTQPGQAAYGAIAEVVRLLEADPNTDWKKVNIEALRQHLIDMDEVTLNSNATERNIPGGLEMNVTGSGRTVSAIRTLLASHAAALEMGDVYRASTTEIPDGAKLVVTARDPNDSSTVARIRGLGFAGLFTEGNHHARHHMALARGESMSHMQ